MQRHRLWLISLLVAGLLAPPALAADEKKDERPVDVELWLIRATTRDKDVSKELKELAKALKKQFKYTGFKLEKKITKDDIDLGKTFKTPLLGKYELAIKPTERSGKRIELELILTKRPDKPPPPDKDGKKKEPKPLLKTKLKLKAGPFMPIGCGTLDEKDYLIVAVRAR